MWVQDVINGDKGPWYYIYNGRWVRGSGAEPLSFWEVRRAVSGLAHNPGAEWHKDKIQEIDRHFRRSLIMPHESRLYLDGKRAAHSDSFMHSRELDILNPIRKGNQATQHRASHRASPLLLLGASLLGIWWLAKRK